MNLPRSDPLAAVSPVDGRYGDRTAPLVEYASAAALARARTRVEVEYLLALADLDATPVAIDADEAAALRDVYESFGVEDARLVDRIEREGAAGYAATGHDVKAVEYFLRTRTAERLHPWIHFGLTSEDVNNLARRLLLRGAVVEVLVPVLEEVRDELTELARDHRDLPMLARTHGQPATPTTFGKELAVYAARLGRALGRVRETVDGLTGKLAGATGGYAAHHVAYPDVDWRAFAREFVAELGLDHEPLTTQVHPCDDIAAVFDALRRVNAVLVDLDRDAWEYVSRDYLGQRIDDETGSSTMPHKVNPTDFENAEGNLSTATAELAFLGDYCTSSRLQRDLSDSTVKRNVGTALAHCLIGYGRTAAGLAAVTPNERAMADDLAAHPEVLAEAVQTALRAAGDPDAYERVKEATRGREASLDDLRSVVEAADMPDDLRERLLDLTPADYTGLAAALVDR